MSDVFLRARERLGLTDRTDRTTELVAERVIWLAQTGILDPAVLLKRTLEEFDVRD